jgi:hypothetical protein
MKTRYASLLLVIVLYSPIRAYNEAAQSVPPNAPAADAPCTDCKNSTTVINNNTRPRGKAHPAPPAKPEAFNQSLQHSESITVDVASQPAKKDSETEGPFDKPKRQVAATSDLLWTIVKAVLLGFAAFILFALIRAVFFPASRYSNRWIVWSVKDQSLSGAEGAVIAALNNPMNPLVAPFIQADDLKRIEARRRRQFLLAPPFLEDAVAFRNFTTVWKDFLGSGSPVAFIEDIPFDADTCPRFVLDQVYEDIDVKVGNYEVKGAMALFRIYKRMYFRQIPQVVGFVSKSPDKSGASWEVRLNANLPTPLSVMDTDFVSSVWAEGDNSDQGDTLGLVAQRAAFKLSAAIADANLFDNHKSRLASGFQRRYDINQIHALAYYRQGIDLLLQLL